MQDFLKQLRSEYRIPIVMVTHDLREAFALADRLIIYAEGRVLQTGSPNEIIASPACPEVGHLVSSRERPNTTVPALSQECSCREPSLAGSSPSGAHARSRYRRLTASDRSGENR